MSETPPDNPLPEVPDFETPEVEEPRQIQGDPLRGALPTSDLLEAGTQPTNEPGKGVDEE
jgi:hypothetical protein